MASKVDSRTPSICPYRIRVEHWGSHSPNLLLAKQRRAVNPLLRAILSPEVQDIFHTVVVNLNYQFDRILNHLRGGRGGERAVFE